MTHLLTLQPSEQELLCNFSKEFLMPHQEIWILRWNTLAAAQTKIEPSMKQLLSLPDRFIPQIIHALELKKYNSVYERYAYLGWQISHAQQSFETALSLIGFQMIALLSAADELLLENKRARKGKKKGAVNLSSALAAFSKFQHNCRLSFMTGYFDVRSALNGITKEELEDQLEKSKLRQKEESFLREILRGTSQHLNFEDIFHVFAHSLRDIGSYDRVSIALGAEDAEQAELIALSSDAPSAVGTGVIIKNDCSLIPAIKNKKPVLHPDISKNEKCEVCMNLVREGIQSFLIVPMTLGEEIIGTLNIGSKNLNFFKQTELPFFQKLANGLAVAVKNANEHSKLLENLKLQQCAAQVISKIRSSLKIEKVMETVCKEIAGCTNADRAFFVELVEPEGSYKIEYEFLNPDSQIKNLVSVKGSYPQEEFKEETELLRKNEVIAANMEGEVHPVLAHSQSLLRSLQVKTICYVPIFIFGKYWGIVGIHHCAQCRLWKKPDIEMLKAIAKEISQAIELAQIYQKEKENVVRLAEAVKSTGQK